MSSAEQHCQRGTWLSGASNQSVTSLGINGSEEELDANDLEVAMINESFEEQMKHSLLFADSNLKSLFYGAPPTMTIPKKHSPGLGTDAVLDFKMDITPPLHLLPPITPPSSDREEELDRGQQLDKELERMMLEGEEEENCPPFSDSPLLMNLNFGDTLNDCDIFQQQDSTIFSPHYSISSVPSLLPECQIDNNLYASFDSQLDDQEDSNECADAAEAIAFDVISSLFADENKYSTDSFSDDDDCRDRNDEESMMINANILQILQNEDSEMDSENEDPKLAEKNNQEAYHLEKDNSNDEQPPPPSRNDSLHTISSPLYTADEQTVPVIDSWEEIGDSPVVAEKVYSEAKAVLKKIRAERKATQL